MHSAFLYHAIRAGLDMAIVNAGMLSVYEDIPPELRERVEDVLLNRRPDATERLLAFAEDVRATDRVTNRDLAWRDARSATAWCTRSSRASRSSSRPTSKRRASKLPRRWRSSRGR